MAELAPQKYGMIREAFRGMHPGLRLVFFISLVLTGTGVAGAFALVLSGGHWDPAGAPKGLQGWMGWVQALNQLLAFGGAAAMYAWLFGGEAAATWVWRAVPRWTWWVAGAVLIGASAPWIDAAMRLNAWVLEALPDAGWKVWMAEQEASMRAATLVLLDLPDLSALLITLLVVTVLPAVCEEWAFRGTLQPLLSQWTGNIHAGIWLGAVFFSAIHLQFEGFLPRMLLGAMLGYLTAASGSLIPAMVGHAINNGSVVVTAYLLGSEYVVESMEAQSAPWATEDYVQNGLLLVGWLVASYWVLRNQRWSEIRRRYLARS